MTALFPALIKLDKSGMYFVQFPDLKEAITDGETMDEALFNAREVLSLTIESRLDEGLETPTPSHIQGEHVYLVAPEARVQAALLIHQARGKRSLADLARSLETSWPAAKRLENPHHSPTLKILDKAASTLGKNLVLSFE